MHEVSISFPGSASYLQGSIDLPASKSISNRILIIQALSKEHFKIENLSAASDTTVLQKALHSITSTNNEQTIDIQDAGTAYRFLTAFLACQSGSTYALKGSERMHQRPIADLVNALRQLEADITYPEHENYPPLLIRGKKLQGGRIKIAGNVSSQFVSAMCLIAPTLQQGLEIIIDSDVVSYTYIEMTLQLMASFGIEYTADNSNIRIPSQPYKSRNFTIENDWSSAAFFYAMAMLADKADFKCSKLNHNSLQGDAFIKTIGENFGIQSNFEHDSLFIHKKQTQKSAGKIYDLNAYPDLAIPLIVSCAIRNPEVSFTGLKHLQYKESNRIDALRTELKKVHINLHYESDLLRFDNSAYFPANTSVHFNTYNDHRIAMSLCLLALEGYTVILDDAHCVRKSFPEYFEQLRNIGFAITLK